MPSFSKCRSLGNKSEKKKKEMYSKLKTVSDLTTGKPKYNLTSCNFLTIFKQFFSSILRNADGFKIFLKIKFRKTQFINILNTAPNTRLTAGVDSFSLTQLTKFIFRNSLTSMYADIDINYFRCLTPPTTTPCRHCRFDNVNKSKTVQRFDNFCKKLHGVG